MQCHAQTDGLGIDGHDTDNHAAPTPSAGRSGFAVAGCPVPDAAFCARGTQAAAALVAGDV